MADGDIAAAESLVKRQLALLPRDSSHDWWHIERVRRLAIYLAQQTGLQGDSLKVVELAALLHDVEDWKYSRQEDAKKFSNTEFLKAQRISSNIADRVLAVIAGIGFKDELANGSKDISPELAVVQDADRLDAIGAVGIARCLTFGGRFNRVLHDPAISARTNLTREEYTNEHVQQTTLNHFDEKLLKLKDMMKTEAGRKVAEGRHRFMVEYLQQFHREWNAVC